MKLEINMIVSNAKVAGDFYRKALNAQVISQTDEVQGMNETLMKLADTEIRVLDENKDFGMFAPAQVGTASIGINLYVADIESFFNNAVNEGCTVLSPVQEFPGKQAKNAVIADKFNHVWVINQQY
ncbi:hypothetical protein RCJ22_26500 [Vibrio sp. FNV 38]|nr:hypothetical protein [Vibrio sp. FNV 38]